METEVKKVKITGMTIRTKDKEIELTMEEARELYDELSPLFSKDYPFTVYPVIYREIPVYPVWPTYPTITWASQSTSAISYTGEVQG